MSHDLKIKNSARLCSYDGRGRGYAMCLNALSLFILNINFEGLCQIQTKCSALEVQKAFKNIFKEPFKYSTSVEASPLSSLLSEDSH